MPAIGSKLPPLSFLLIHALHLLLSFTTRPLQADKDCLWRFHGVHKTGKDQRHSAFPDDSQHARACACAVHWMPMCISAPIASKPCETRPQSSVSASWMKSDSSLVRLRAY